MADYVDADSGDGSSSSDTSRPKSRSGASRGAAAAGRGLSEAGQQMMQRSADQASSRADAILGSMKRGGKVKRTGNYRLHAGEYVKPARKGKGRGKKGRVGKGRY